MKIGASLPVIDRMFDLIKWYTAHVAKFPRSHRYSLGSRIEAKLYDILEGLIEAQYAEGAAKEAPLVAVNFRLESLRFLTRLSHELTVLSGKSHEFASREINEIGRVPLSLRAVASPPATSNRLTFSSDRASVLDAGLRSERVLSTSCALGSMCCGLPARSDVPRASPPASEAKPIPTVRERLIRSPARLRLRSHSSSPTQNTVHITVSPERLS